MALESPEANLLNSLIEKIASLTNTNTSKTIRYIEQDMGQLDNYEIRPKVAWPCALLDIDEQNFTELQNHTEQLANGMITVRIGLVKYSDVNNLATSGIREKGLQYFETERKVVKALHGWAPAGFSKLLRRASFTERRNDDIRVRVIKFAYSYTDEVGKKTKTVVPRPGGQLGVNNPNS